MLSKFKEFLIVIIVAAISAYIITTTLLLLQIDYYLAAGITLVTVYIEGVLITLIRINKRLNLLEEKCDPQAFLDATEKQRKGTGKNSKMNAILDINKSAALISMGEFREAKETLLSIDKSKLSNNNLLVYTINMICCLYELGGISEADELLETQVKMMKPFNKKIAQAKKSLIAESLFYSNKYEESKKMYQECLQLKTSKRVRLDILYRLAQIDELNGDIESARTKYMEVAENGNKLWIAQQSKQHLLQM